MMAVSRKKSIGILIILCLLSGCEASDGLDGSAEYHSIFDDDTASSDDESDDVIDDTADDATADDAQDDTADDALDDSSDDSLDPEADPDGDGIITADEIVAGTDPLNPADATAWHPEITDFPRLTLDRNGWLDVKAKIESGDALAGEVYGTIRSIAARDLYTQEADAFDPRYTEENARTAKSAAFVAFIEDDADFAQKAVRTCYSEEFSMDRLAFSDFDQGTIHGGMALVDFSGAYDLLAGFSLVNDRYLQACEENILKIANQLWSFYLEDIPVILRFIQNNHNIKLSSGFGIVGMTFNDISVAAKYVNYGLTESTYFLMDFQNCDGGCQAEGPNYLDYSISTFLPFYIAYHRYARGATFPYRVICTSRFDPNCTEGNVDILDPLKDERLAEIMRWRFQITLPSGYAAPMDDSNFSCGYPGHLAALLQDSAWAWLFTNSIKCRHAVGALPVELLALQDAIPDAQEPSWPATSMMPHAGQAVLRSGWGADEMFAMILGENGNARVHGLGHEHPDGGSFIFYAKGEYFALDSGYIHFTERSLVADADNHNLILADGEGPPYGFLGVACGTDAFLSDLKDEEFFKVVRIKTNYAGAELERVVAMIPDVAFLTFDRISDTVTRMYDWLFHANAGGSTDGAFSLNENGAFLERPQAVMAVHLTSNSGIPELSTAEDYHGFYGVPETHEVLHGRVTSESVLYLSVSAPAMAEDQLPSVEFESVGPASTFARIRTDDYLVFVGSSDEADGLDLDSTITQTRRLQTDARNFIVITDVATFDVLAVYLDGGTYAEYGGEPL